MARLEPGLLGVGGVEDLDGVLVALGPAGVHPHQHLGEVGRVDAAGAGADRDERVAHVVLAGEQGADLERLDGLVDLDAGRPRPPRRVSASLSSWASSSSTLRSSSRSWRFVNRSRSPWSSESRPVTRVALAWSSHRSGAATCSPRSAISARIASRSSTCSMVCIVAWSCLIWVSKSGPATTGNPTRPGRALPACPDGRHGYPVAASADERSSPMPQQAWSEKRERQYEHVKDGLEDQRSRESTAEEIAARTVNKERARAGEAEQASRTLDRRPLLGPARRPPVATRARAAARRRSSTTRPSDKGVEGRSRMTKAAAREGPRTVASAHGRRPLRPRRRVRVRAAHPQPQRAAPGAAGHPDRRADPDRLPADPAVHQPVLEPRRRCSARLPRGAVRLGDRHRPDHRAGGVPPGAVPARRSGPGWSTPPTGPRGPGWPRWR